MGYAFMSINKLKSSKEITSRYQHNYRIYDVGNADPLLYDRNEELVSLNGLDYEAAANLAVAEMKGYGAMKCSPRKDAVRALEVMMTFSHSAEDTIDIDEWKQACMDWLDRTFNPEDHRIDFEDCHTGEPATRSVQNIKSAVLHLDEDTPHIHAFVVPIDDKGHLNAKSYLSDRMKMRHLQDTFAKEMEKFDLKRGEKNSIITPDEKKRFRNGLKRAVNETLPAPEPNESAMDYFRRANEAYIDRASHHLDDINKMRTKYNVVRAENITLKEDMVELERMTGCADIRKIADGYNENRAVHDAIDRAPDSQDAQRMQEMLDRILHDFNAQKKYHKKER